MLIVESPARPFILDAVKASEKGDISVFAVTPTGSQQAAHAAGVNRLLYEPNHSRVPDPYDNPGFSNVFESRRTDSFGRDVLGNLLFEAGKSLKQPVQIIDFGGNSIGLTAELLTRARFEGFQGGGLKLKVFDLSINGVVAAWGPGAIRFAGYWDRIRQLMKETPEGKAAVEFIDPDFRLYFMRCPLIRVNPFDVLVNLELKHQ